MRPSRSTARPSPSFVPPRVRAIQFIEVLNNYLSNQQEGGLPVPDGELLADGLDGLPAPPSEAGEGDADSDASGA